MGLDEWWEVLVIKESILKERKNGITKHQLKNILTPNELARVSQNQIIWGGNLF